MNLSQLFNLQYWLDIRPDGLSLPFIFIFFVFFILIMLSKILFFIYLKKNKNVFQKPTKKFVQKIGNAFFSLGLCGLLWLFFAYEQVPFLSARFWLIIWLFSAILWAYFIVRFKQFELEPLLKHIAERERLEKWMPKRQ